MAYRYGKIQRELNQLAYTCSRDLGMRLQDECAALNGNRKSSLHFRAEEVVDPRPVELLQVK
jgi:hypothetical protein